MTIPPSIVSNLTASISTLTSASLSWNVTDQSSWQIDYFNVYWDQGLGIWSLLTNTSSTTSTATVQTGYTYQFKVTAHNLYGESPVSNIASIKMAQAPSAMASITTS
jgi:hypothetical protein